MKRVDQLRRDDANDAAMPALAADDEHRPCADIRIGEDHLLRGRENLGLFFLAADVLVVERHRQLAHLLGHGFIRGEQEARGQVGRAHAPGGVDARREEKGDVIAVDRLAAQP